MTTLNGNNPTRKCTQTRVSITTQQDFTFLIMPSRHRLDSSLSSSTFPPLTDLLIYYVKLTHSILNKMMIIIIILSFCCSCFAVTMREWVREREVKWNNNTDWKLRITISGWEWVRERKFLKSSLVAFSSRLIC